MTDRCCVCQAELDPVDVFFLQRWETSEGGGARYDGPGRFCERHYLQRRANQFADFTDRALHVDEVRVVPVGERWS